MSITGLLKSLLQNRDNTVQTPPSDRAFDGLLKQLVIEVHETSESSYSKVSFKTCPTYAEIKAFDSKTKIRLMFYLAQLLVSIRIALSKQKYFSSQTENGRLQSIYDALLTSLLRMKQDFGEEEIIALLDFFHNNSSTRSFYLQFITWPIGFTIIQIERYVKQHGLSETMGAFIKRALSWPEFDKTSNSWGTDLQKAKLKLQNLLHIAEGKGSAVPKYRLPKKDVLGKHINETVDKLDTEFKNSIYEMFHLALTASAGKPPAKFLKSSKEILSRTDTARYKSCLNDWLVFLTESKPTEQRYARVYDKRQYTWTEITFLNDKNATLVKGLIWSLCQFNDRTTMDIIAKLAERSFHKIPGVGPTCAGVGNACIFYLSNVRDIEGIAHLSRLKLRITQNNTRKLIVKYIQEASEKRGISPAEIEEQAVPDFGLTAGIREEAFEGYTLKLMITGVGKTKLEWYTPDDKLQKSTPSFVKSNEKFGDRLKHLKNNAKQIQKYVTAQRDRIDRSYIENRAWSYPDFLTYYMNHGLVSFIARRLIWMIDMGGTSVSAIWRDGRLEDVKGDIIDGMDASTNVRLWHPLLVDIDDVMAWRQRLNQLEIQQPMKQAYREVYILTDAEQNTRSYSNRMAAHLLKQHQFNALTGLRGWKYSLLGAYDDGRDGEIAQITLAAHNITAEFWINEIYAEEAFNDAGIWDYVSTDQLRFIDASGTVMNLIDVPKVVFSEIMRDADLFVGVASVGNDPEWLDHGGIPEYREYWTTYSFGDLTEVAKTRKTVLTQFLPRLKIRDQVAIDGKFLRVRGKLREYKIHIGSTNILMEPNDQYLCIVPALAKKSTTGNVFLPFEEDRGLSLILSKAILLADDDCIEDRTILNQINHRS